jgi:glutamine cyclotransferase
MKIGAWRSVLFVCALILATGAQAAVPTYGYHIVHAYPHDPGAFTEGLFYLDGFIYESTGLEGRSSIRKEKLDTGEVLQSRPIPPQYFGEGIVAWKDRLIELTWRSHMGFVYDLKTFAPLAQFQYPGEGWALTRDDHRLIMSDGTSELRFIDPDSLKEIGRVRVTDEGRPVDQLNELEYVKGEVYANIWQTNRIARIDPATGKVVGWIDLTGLLSDADRGNAPVDVLNGIAYDAKSDRLFVTGKLWPKLFEIKLVRNTGVAEKPKAQHP